VSGVDLDCFESIAALPPSARALLDGVGRENLFTSRAWYESFVAAGLSPDAQPLFLTLPGSDGNIRAVIPCQRRVSDDPQVSSLTSFYSCDFRPLIAPDGDAAATAFELGRKLAERFSGEATIRLDSLDSTLPTLEPFLAGLAHPGRAILRYAYFGRWWETVEGRDFPAYLSARDGALREVIRRKGARLAREGATFTMIAADSGAADVERSIADYEAVYAASWKVAEPFPEFQPTLMRKLAREGWLRLAICRLGERPIAAQFWVVVGRTATVLKLAHDRQFDKQSPGTLLTAFAIRTLMDNDRIAHLDFGRGDDAYKKGWATHRTPHIGVLSVDIKRRPLLVARHLAGAALRRLKGAGAAA
jgi:CelD/BcsL family acetyltransferase involved in cellulose biosynthesis